MNTLIEQLRKGWIPYNIEWPGDAAKICDKVNPLMRQAADEIERLEQEIERAKDDRNKSGVVERRKYLPEIERLRAALKLIAEKGGQASPPFGDIPAIDYNGDWCAEQAKKALGDV